MKQESKQCLDAVACIARANLVYHQQKLQQERSQDEAGAAMLMSVFLEMYEHWQNNEPGITPPPDRIYFAATSCVELRKELELEPRHNWIGEEGFIQLMTFFMFLFKHMCVLRIKKTITKGGLFFDNNYAT